jgi:hypothetical protein
MANNDLKDRDHPVAARQPGERGTAASEGSAGQAAAGGGLHGPSGDAAGGEHHVAKPHGKPAVVDTTLPGTRPELLAMHREARARRNRAPLGSDAFLAAVELIARIEVRIAAIDRAHNPPLV